MRRAIACLQIILAGLLTVALLSVHVCCAPVAPATDRVYTSTRYITGILVDAAGTVWAATSGGVLHRDSTGAWRKYTTADGLPSNEVQSLRRDTQGVTAVTPLGAAVLHDGHWQAVKTPDNLTGKSVPGQIAAVNWQGGTCGITPDSLYVQTDTFHRQYRLADTLFHSGTHFSALLPLEKSLYLGIYGGGIAVFDGKRLDKLTDPPEGAREITALGGVAEHLWVGTRRAGLWEYEHNTWTQHLQPDEPYHHNCQALLEFQHNLYVSTLEDGLLALTPQGWQQYAAPTISSNAPRQLVVFQNKLYVRHGNGMVDLFDGAAWQKNIARTLPRRDVSGLAADAHRLYAAQWGGWSEFDGAAWSHHLKEPALQGLVVPLLFPDGDTLWVGTQQHGLGAWIRVTGGWQWHDERHGLPDDWVRCVARVGNRLYAGTFVGGLVCRQDGAWHTLPGLSEGEITALATDGAGGLYAGTRTGLWRVTAAGVPMQMHFPFLAPEIQALAPTADGLWVGTRTGIYFVSKVTLQ